MANIIQHFIFTFLANIGPLAFGLHLGWLGPFVVDMRGESDKPSPYMRALTPDEISWLGSLPSASMMIATPCYGLLLRFFSYKPLTIFTNTIHCFAFALYLVPDVYVAYAARFAAGFASVGSIVITPLYVNDCVEHCYRGFLGALTSLSITLGVAVAYFTGSCTTFLITNSVSLFCSLLFYLGVVWIPDSPVWFVMHKKVPAARKSLLKLRYSTVEEADREILSIQKEVDTSCCEEIAGILSVLKDKGMRKALFLAMGMMVTQQSTGIAPMQLYYELILPPEPFVAPTIAIIQLLSVVTGALVLNHVGRKTILLATSAIICASYTCLWLILDMQAKSSKMLLIPAMIYFAAYNIGLGTVPFVMLPEILPQHARAVSVTVAGLLTGIVAFLYAKFFPIFVDLYHPKYAILIFLVMSILGTVFITFCLFETKGKSASEVYQILLGAGRLRSTRITSPSVSSPTEQMTSQVTLNGA